MIRIGQNRGVIPAASQVKTKKLRKAKQIPPENKIQDGVQIFFTTGHIPISPIPYPKAANAMPITTNCKPVFQAGIGRVIIPPAINPRIIVASVGIKLMVE